MKIGILQTGRSPDELRQKHGDYDALFGQLLGGRGFEFVTYPVLDGVLPSQVADADGWLITGSKFGVYEDHAWIAPLEDFLRRVFAEKIPIIGVCFGHQILAQALGGKVEKFQGGWTVGATEYEGDNGADQIMAWHQDQVVELPEGAEVLASSDGCKYAMLGYGDQALTLQPHPEFTPEFMQDLLELRRGILPAHIAAGASSRMRTPLTSRRIADRIETFFKTSRAFADV